MIIASLGSSFAAGPGMPRSQNYPHQLAARLGAQLTDLTRSGATTADLPMAGVPRDADVITITAGGNDLGYLKSVMAAALTATFENRPATFALASVFRGEIPSPGEADIARTAAGLQGVVARAKEKAPGARILLVEYLAPFGPETQPGLFTSAQLAKFAAIQHALDEAYERVGAEIVRVDRGHALGSAEPWVNGYRGLLRLGASFHPNVAGMAGVADAVVRQLS